MINGSSGFELPKKQCWNAHSVACINVHGSYCHTTGTVLHYQHSMVVVQLNFDHYTMDMSVFENTR